LLIGIAGKTGSGKSFIASLLEKKGWKQLDLDIVAHKVLDAEARAIERKLGPGLLDNKGKIDRKILGSKVFSNPEALKILEEITYPGIEKETRKWIDSLNGENAVIHAVNLHKTSLADDCDIILWVTSPWYIRRRRVLKRDKRSWNDIKGRFRSQKSLNPKLFSDKAEIYTVRNRGNLKRLEYRLNRILSRLEGGRD